MLVLTRRLGERIFVGDGPDRIVVSVERIEGGQIRIGIVAPRDVNIVREELVDPDDRRPGP